MCVESVIMHFKFALNVFKSKADPGKAFIDLIESFIQVVRQLIESFGHFHFGPKCKSTMRTNSRYFGAVVQSSERVSRTVVLKLFISVRFN